MVTGTFPGPPSMNEVCELCRRPALEAVYAAERSPRGLTVQLCRHCGLIQSLPRIDRAPRATASASSGADWGNVRYGKGFRTQAAMTALKRHVEFSNEIQLLDVGSNRGGFARVFLDAAPNASIVAVEPDERVARSCASLERCEIVQARIEDIALESGRFDVIHSCHTIEHLASPAHILADHWRTLKPGGLLLIDAPNIAILDNDDMVEEWFIDKHLFHFSARTLMRMIAAAGFEIVAAPDMEDRENLLIVARKAYTAYPASEADPREVSEAERLITAYVTNRARNLSALTFVATAINDMAPKRVAMWGAGRIFDTLVVHGRFTPASLSLLIDSHLKAHMDDRFGCKLTGPEALPAADPDVVIVMSRGFAGEIAAEARRLAPRADIVFYADLLADARMSQAA
jgi:2-polyprenyl-3-methyl-5-hydroxy-6-metoxy-1,4-benzoquinol methylase